MFNQDQNAMQGSAYTASTSVDAGLRAYMIRIYNLVAAGLAVSGLVAYAIASTPALYPLVFNPITMWGSFLVMLFMCFTITPNKLVQGSLASANLKYYAFTFLMGISLAGIFAAYSNQSITRVFFITAAMFAGVSLYGYTTRSNLMAFGSFLMMGLIGIIIASIVNIFLHSTGLQFVVSIVSVLVFTGLIAYQTQAARRYYSGNVENDNKMAVFSAFGLYINFINLFTTLLRLLGNRN